MIRGLPCYASSAVAVATLQYRSPPLHFAVVYFNKIRGFYSMYVGNSMSEPSRLPLVCSERRSSKVGAAFISNAPS